MIKQNHEKVKTFDPYGRKNFQCTANVLTVENADVCLRTKYEYNHK